jgi:hypothetical protein
METRAQGEFLAGLFYWDRNSKPLAEQMNLSDTPLYQLAEKSRPSVNVLDEILAGYE